MPAVIARSREGFRAYGGGLKLWGCRDPEVVIAGPFETGKAQPVDEPVLTPSGWRAIGGLKVGDEVCAVDGSVTTVTGVFPQGSRPLYRLTTDDGGETVASDDHLWLVGRRFHARRTLPDGRRKKMEVEERWDLRTTAQLAALKLRRMAGKKRELRRRLFLPLPAPLAGHEQPLPLDPYLLGVLISEGSLTGDQPGFTTTDQEMVDRCLAALPDGCRLSQHRITYSIADDSQHRNQVTLALRDLGLMGKSSFDKFVPALYLFAQPAARLALLQGILDGDGTVDHRLGSVSFSTASPQLAADAVALVRSLGGVAVITPRPTASGNTDYRTRISHDAPETLFSLPRKATLARRSLPVRRMIDAVTYIGDGECVCISVAHPSRLYITRDFIVTHNTITALHKVNVFLSKYPGAMGLMIRLRYKYLLGSVVRTYEDKVLAVHPDEPGAPVTKYGGEKPEFYQYPNGSRLYLGGLDNAAKFLSSEWDIIFVPQCEEIPLSAWEQLTGRATGRAGHAPYAQVIGDANPAASNHWILKRDAITFIRSRHEDNPTLYERDDEGELTGRLTPQGEITMNRLQALTGLRRKRGYEGLWVTAEGTVYDWDPDVYLVDDFQPPPDWRKYRVIDFGFTNPFVCQWWAEDEDGRLFLYRELYRTQKTVAELLPWINELSRGEAYVATIADHDAEDRATLARGIVIPTTGRVIEPGIFTLPADKRISVGIESVRERMKVRGDGRPRIFFCRGALTEPDDALEEAKRPQSTIDEFPLYVYPEAQEGRDPKEIPVGVDDHGMDCVRYLCMFIDGPPPPEVREVTYL